ncbi:MAG TPA: cbb3-type cytochrome c oxidase subunit I, partial [Opitutaceae bacterium]|nr:cbb3-type cytochrome c oxidase subunit I [Opitutaceae bacterium]
PRLNAFSFWTFLAGAIILNASWFVPAGAPDVGWFGYANLTSRTYSPDASTDFWIMGLQILGVASIAASLNFITTIVNLRALGLTMMRLPVFVWMTLITSFLIILAFPAITIALVELMMDRQFGTNFYEVSNGGLPILWIHLFWVFGHPEVYIIILPAMGIISEILPTFARKPLFGYPLVVFSGALIGVLGFGVWSHHMFTTGMGTVATAAFALATMAIAVPTGVKIFNWIGTLWRGHLQMRTPMLFALGFLWMFMMGGFSGIMHAAAPADTQQHNSYFVVAHFHYVLIGGSVFALLAGIHYWLPKMCGRKVSERWGRVSFWLIFVGFNTTFFPMHFLGLNGMPRRTFTYDGNMGWNTGNLVSSIGAAILGIGIAIYFGAMIYTWFRGEKVGGDPWDGRTLEWSLASPPRAYNFAVLPTVHSRDDWWNKKYDSVRAAEPKPAPDPHGIHMPDQSWYPLLASLGLLIGGFGVVYHTLAVAVAGLLVLLAGIYLWALEGPGGYHVKPEKEE